MRLKGKATLVTAAGAGIGRATALAFHAEGAVVHATDIDGEALAKLAGEAPGLQTTLADVRSESDIERLFAEIPRCDVLFNCAGIVPNGTVLESSIADFNAAWDLNLLSMVRTIKAALPKMLEQGGAIINMSSVASSVTGVPNRCAYGATKAAVIGLTKAVAADFVAKGIRCNAICPGTVDTPSLRARIQAHDNPEGALAAFIARQPMGRFGRAEEIASMAVHLASDEAAFITGQVFVVDGGWTI